jgi:hypothetical protein
MGTLCWHSLMHAQLIETCGMMCFKDNYQSTSSLFSSYSRIRLVIPNCHMLTVGLLCDSSEKRLVISQVLRPFSITQLS